MTENKRLLLLFIIGASLLSAIISFSYIGHAFKQAGRPSDVPYEIFPVFILFMFGLTNVVSYWLMTKYKLNPNWIFVFGGLMGVIFSFFGRFGLDLPKRIFGFNTPNEHLVHLYAFILYGLIFRFIVLNLNRYFGLM